jgi:hypothetical protein
LKNECPSPKSRTQCAAVIEPTIDNATCYISCKFPKPDMRSCTKELKMECKETMSSDTFPVCVKPSKDIDFFTSFDKDTSCFDCKRKGSRKKGIFK